MALRRILVLSVLTAAIAWSATAEKLVPANLNDRNDGLGMRWDVRPDGQINDGNSDCFDGGMVLQINNQSFQQTQAPQQTTDGSEVVLTGRCGQLMVIRRLKLDTKRNAMRYVEQVTNAGKKNEQVAVTLRSQLGNHGMQTVWLDGKSQTGNVLPKLGGGLAALQNPGDSRPSVIWLIGDPKAPAAPALAINNNREYTFTWNLTLKSQESAMLLHYVLQRPALNANQVTDAVKPLWKKGVLVKPDVPHAWFRQIRNFRLGGGDEESEELQRSGTIARLLERAGITEDDGRMDLVGVGRSDAERMRGHLTGGPLTVTTPNGPVTITTDELAGSEGGDPVAVLHLRSGESLAATRIDGALALETEAGVALPVDVFKALWMATHALRTDAKAPADQRGLLELVDGTCLGLAGLDAMVALSGSWGRIELPLARIHHITRVLEPTPAWRVTCDDGSTVRAVPEAGDLAVTSKRFGTLTIPVGTVMAFHHADARPISEDEPTDGARLVSGERLAGGLAGPTLTLRAGGQDSAVPVERIVAIERPEDGIGNTVAVVLADGGRLVGEPRGGAIGFLASGTTLRIPVTRLSGWTAKPKPEADPDAEANQKDQNGKGEEKAEKAAKKSDAGKPTEPKATPAAPTKATP